MESQFERSLRAGRTGEELVRKFFLRCGCGVVTTADYSGAGGDRAPSMHLERGKIVLPDLDVMSGLTGRFWVEVKTYWHAVENRRLGKIVHGIPARNYAHYINIRKRSTSDVWLAIVEVETSVLLAQRIERLSVVGCSCCGCVAGTACEASIKGGIDRGVYWPRDAMIVVATFTPSEMMTVRKAWQDAGKDEYKNTREQLGFRL